MKGFGIRTMLIGIAMMAGGMVLGAAPAAAQATRTWVSGVGDDANPCSRTAPCKTFAGAISKTAAGGTINCLDPGGWGSVTIVKSMTIDCEQFPGSILNAGVPGITINALTTDSVTIRGLTIAGGTGGSSGTYGINILSAGSVLVDNVKIFNQAQASPSGFGIRVAPSTGNVQVTVTRSTISGGTSGGISVNPSGPVPASLYVSDTQFNGNAGAAIALTTAGGGTVLTAVITNTSITGSRVANSSGIIAKTTTGTATIFVQSSTIANNAVYGINANGAGSTIRVSGTGIVGNATGVNTANSGQAISYGTNQLADNATPGAFTSTVPQN